MRGNIQAVEALAHVFGELGQGNPETIIPLITGAVATLGAQAHGASSPSTAWPTPPDGLTFDARDGLYFKRALTASSNRRHPARGQDRQHPHQASLRLLPIVHKGKVLGALSRHGTDGRLHHVHRRPPFQRQRAGSSAGADQGHILFRGRGPIPLARYNNIAGN